MEELRKELASFLDRLDDPVAFRNALEDLHSIYPFSEFEYIISHLLAAGKLTIDEYYEIRDNYNHRNVYLNLFEKSPAGFGQEWAHGHLRSLVPSLQLPSIRLDPNYSSGQYDFYLFPDIRIEVKASRAVDAKSKGPLYLKALASSSGLAFDMNFQQMKPSLCDVFVWLAVWRDVIRYWVIPSYNVENNQYFSSRQHRGNVGEGQLHLKYNNIHEFDQFLVQSDELEAAIQAAYQSELSSRRMTT